MKKLIISAAFLLTAFAGAAQEKCKAITKAKTQCTRTAVVNGYCKQHNPDAVRCLGTTKEGKPCQLIPKKGEQYCYHHKNQTK